MRPIDADVIKRQMCKKCNDDYSDEPCEPNDCVFVNAINDAPTIDAVPVVRCKDCVKCDTWKCHMEQTEHHPDGDIHHVYHGENDYCSYGEKREDKP